MAARIRRTCLHCATLVLAIAGSSAAQSPDALFLAGLRERQLFELAERHCQERLASASVVDPLRTELLVEQIRTLATHALHAPPGERERLWKEARQVAADAAKAMPPLPRLVLVRLQDALVPLAAGELARQEYETGSLAGEQLEPARQALRDAETLLAAIDKELTAEIPLRRRTPKVGGLSADELVSLQQQARRELARAHRNRALLYPAGSNDRLALVLRATESLQTTISQLAADDPLLAELRLDWAECQRLLGRFDEAGEQLAALDAEGVAPSVRLAARAELIRLALVKEDLPTAEGLIERGQTLAGVTSAELDLAWFEAQLSLARVAKEPAIAKQHQDRAAELARSIQREHGAYFGRRADQLLAAYVTAAKLPQTPGTVSVELLARAADRLFVQREFARAMAAYDDASAQARAAGDLQASFTLAYKAALIEQARQQHGEAARRFRTLAKNLATHPQAPAAHLAAAWHAAQLVKTNDSKAGDAYGEILREHLSAWPGSETTSQVRLWLGRWHDSRHEWADAAAAYALVARGSEHFPSAVSGLAAASRQQLVELAAAGEATAEPAAAAINRLHKAIVSDSGGLPAKWTTAERTAALAAAAIMLQYRTGEAPTAEKLLAEALANPADAPADWRAAATAQLVVAQASQPERQGAASQTLRQLGSESPEQLIAVIDGLSRVREQSSAAQREPIAKLQLEAIELLAPRRDTLPADMCKSLDRAEAEALAAAGQRDGALAAYRKLAAANPDDGDIQQGYAELLLAGDDHESLQAALREWRTIASRSRPRSERWMLAKYSVALAQFKLGDKASAAALLAYVLETPPGLAERAWEAKYRELLAKCIP